MVETRKSVVKDNQEIRRMSFFTYVVVFNPRK